MAIKCMGEECVPKMPRKKEAKKPPRPIPGTFQANIQLPITLHETMKAIRRARCEIEQEDVKLHKIYREAIQQYIDAKPQQAILNGSGKALRRTA
jgi:hypothetical protein